MSLFILPDECHEHGMAPSSPEAWWSRLPTQRDKRRYLCRSTSALFDESVISCLRRERIIALKRRQLEEHVSLACTYRNEISRSPMELLSHGRHILANVYDFDIASWSTPMTAYSHFLTVPSWRVWCMAFNQNGIIGNSRMRVTIPSRFSPSVFTMRWPTTAEFMRRTVMHGAFGRLHSMRNNFIFSHESGFKKIYGERAFSFICRLMSWLWSIDDYLILARRGEIFARSSFRHDFAWDAIGHADIFSHLGCRRHFVDADEASSWAILILSSSVCASWRSDSFIFSSILASYSWS